MPAQAMQVPTRVPLVISPENRDNTSNKDAKLINCYVEVDKEQNVHLFRRPGMKQWGVPPGTTAAGMGAYWWNGAVYSIFAGKLYKNLSLVASSLDTTGGVYSFSSIMGATPKLVFQNGVAGYAYDDTALVTGPLHGIASSYPQYTCKGVAYLDGQTYVLQHFFATSITPAVIWGSAVNSVTNPTDWDPLDFITAQMTPDSGVYLAKQLVYVVCLKEWSTEFFYDAGNATGSPLAPAMNLRLSYGCAAQDSVQSIADVLFWVSTNREASNQIVMVDRAQLSVISTPQIDRLLRDADFTTVYSWHIKIDGHSFYVLTIKNNNLTLAYDVNQNRWEEWTDVNGNYVPIVCSTRDQAGHTILQHETNGALYYGSTDYLDDNGQLIPITIVTPRWDAGTSRKKQLSMMNFVCDVVPGSLMSVQVSDDDYTTWSQPRMVDLSMKFPNLPNCGTFRRRSWKFQVNHNLPWRLEAAELQFDIGTL